MSSPFSAPAAVPTRSAVAKTFPDVRASHNPLEVSATAATAAASATVAVASSSGSSTSSPRRNGNAACDASTEDLEHVNKKLQQSVELLQNAIVRLGDDSKQQLEAMASQLEQLLLVNQAVRAENTELKARVADDVLRQRQTNRIEMAMEKAKIASRVRTSGRQRLEGMEAVLMEAHDDLFHVQRFDAALAPQREVSFVFHYVSNVVFPLDGAEQFVMNVYQQILRSTAQRLRGYTVSSCMGLDVFAFQSASVALEFAKDCHEQVVRLSWPDQTERVPFFSTIAESGYVLFRGPRIHTCIYTCDPESEVNAATGRTIYFGPDAKLAVDAALSVSAVGEIAVNGRCSEVLSREHRVLTDGVESRPSDNVDALRQSLGRNWDVVRLPNTYGMVASLLPLSLKGRRGVDVGQLSPTPKYPVMDGIDPQATAQAVLKTLKGQKVDVVEMHGGRKRVARFVESNAEPDNTVYDSASKLLEFYTVQRERDNIVALYRRTEQSAAALERGLMESEDRYEVSRRKPLDPSETAYVCTIDTGDDSVWAKVLSSSSMQGERDQVQNQVRSAIHTFARQYYGFLMNGNYVDIFTYVFREVEQALAFVSGVYIQINRLGTKLTGQGVFLMRAGISCGPMSTIYRNMEDGMLKCTGPVIRLSATLSDLAQNGEILAMEDVIQEFHKKNENLIDTQYNMVRQQSRLIGDYDNPSVVHSILPRPFAFRRQQLMNSAAAPAAARPRAGRSAKAVLALRQKQFARRDVEKLLSEQLERLERLEASRMATEDMFEQTEAPLSVVVRNPWMFTSQPQVELVRKPKPGEAPLPLPVDLGDGRRASAIAEGGTSESSSSRRGVGLGFLFCDVSGATWIARELSSELLDHVYQHYNSIVQDTLRECGAYIVKTSGITGYVAAFSPPLNALEAAVQIQQRLVTSSWPADLHTLEPTLFVKDTRTGRVLFNGLRAQVAVHYSTHYKWKPLPPPPPPPSSGSDDAGAASASGARAGAQSRSASKNGGAGNASSSSSGSRGRGTGAASSPPSASRRRAGAVTPQPPSNESSASRRRNDKNAAGSGNSRSRSGGGGADEATASSTVAGRTRTEEDFNAVITYIEVSSTAMSELVYLGRLAHGGEIRMSLPFVDVVRRATPGRLLLEQLTMRIVVPTSAPPAITTTSHGGGNNNNNSSNAANKRAGGSEEGRDGTATGPSRGGGGRPRSSSSAMLSTEIADDEPLSRSVKSDAEGGGSSRGVADEPPRRRSRASSKVQAGTDAHAVPPQLASAGSSSSSAPQNEMVVSRWIVAVPRSLDGRFPFLLPTNEPRPGGGRGGGDSGSGAAEALASTTATATTTATSGGRRRSTTAGAESRSRSARQRSASEVSTRTDNAAASRRDAPWFLQTESSTLPLPCAARGVWDQPRIVTRSGHPEAELVQNALEYVLRLFPSDLQDASIIRRVAAAATTTDGTLGNGSLTSPLSPLSATGLGSSGHSAFSGGAAAGAVDMNASTRSHMSGSLSITGGARPGSDNHGETVPSPATQELMAQDHKKRTEAARHYVRWMRAAQHVLSCVLGGFRVGNDGVKPPKTRKNLSPGHSATAHIAASSTTSALLTLEPPVSPTEDGDERLFSSTTIADCGASGTLAASLSVAASAQEPPGAAVVVTAAGAVDGGEVIVPSAVSLGVHTGSPDAAGTRLPLPSPPPADFSTAPPVRAPLADALRLGGGGKSMRSAGASGGGGGGAGSSNASDNYWRALDGLDDACRSLAEETGRALGKVAVAPPAVPQAPRNVAKKSMGPTRRRF